MGFLEERGKGEGGEVSSRTTRQGEWVKGDEPELGKDGVDVVESGVDLGSNLGRKKGPRTVSERSRRGRKRKQERRN